MTGRRTAMTESVNPLLNASGLIDYASVRPEHVAPAVETLSKNLEETLARVTAPETPATWEAVAEPLEKATLAFTRGWGVVGHLQSVVDTPALRDAYNAALPAVTQLFIDLSQNEALFAKYKAMTASDGLASLPPVRRRIIERELRDFRLSGAELPEAERARVKVVGERLSMLSQKFSENLLDATNAWELVVTDETRLAGIPEDARALFAANAKSAGKEGWRITLHFPSYLPVMQYADDRSLRETLYRAFSTRASEFDGGKYDNTPLISEILRLRREEAALLSFADYAESSLATKMADTPAEVIAFLRDLASRAKPFAEKDMAALRAFAADELDIADMQPWDQAYASEKLRQARYSYSDQEVKQYFTEPTVFSGLFKLAETLYGIRIRPATASVWHSDVKYFEVCRDDEVIASFYADLYAREGKRSGAWMDADRTRCVMDGVLQTPVAYLVCNFAQGVNGRPATLTHDDVTTLFHEFGHALHFLFHDVKYRGLSEVEGDFVELPSQIMENWATEKEFLDLWAVNYKTGEPIPADLIAKIVAAENYQAAYFNVRQLLYGLNDMAWHSIDKPFEGDVELFERTAMAPAQVLPVVEGAAMSPAFSHIFAGGYAAGYYGYKWAEVLAADAFSLFKEKGIFNPEVAEAFRREILSKGGHEHPMTLYVNFRGHKPETKALIEKMGLEK